MRASKPAAISFNSEFCKNSVFGATVQRENDRKKPVNEQMLMIMAENINVEVDQLILIMIAKRKENVMKKAHAFLAVFIFAPSPYLTARHVRIPYLS